MKSCIELYKVKVQRWMMMLLLTMLSVGANAKVNIEIGSFTGGKITATQGEEKNGEVEITLTVTPDKGYTITKDDITVVATFAPQASRGNTRQKAPDLGSPLTLNGKDPADLSEKRDYTLTIDANLGVWVKEAKFTLNGAKGDDTPNDTPNYSGTYYIGSVGYNAAKTTDNFYLCPTEGWCYYAATDDFTGTANEMPFLTTYKCRTSSYHNGDASNAVWTIEKAPSPNDAYYYIKQASTGRYLTSNGQIGNAGIDRMRVHLEAINNPNDAGNIILFDISLQNNSYFVISPQGIQETGTHDKVDHSTHRWLVVNGGNKNSLKGESGKTGGPSTTYNNTAGIIGIYTMDDTNAKFYLEVPAPTISHSDGFVSISHVFNDVDIYYTTNGNNPTASSTLYNGTFTPPIGSSQVKAIAISRVSGIKSTVATYNLPKLEAPTISVVIPNPSDVTSLGTATITTTVDGAIIFYTTNNTNPSTGSGQTTGDVSFTGPTTIKARVGKAGYAMSDVTTKQIVKVETPTFRDNGNLAIVIESGTLGADIRYTYGDTEPADPTESSPLYSNPLTGMKDKYIKAIAMKSENYNSDIASSGKASFKCAKPVIKRTASDKFTITCSNPANATIYYTTNGNTPTSSNTGISTGTVVNITESLPLTIKAIAIASGFDDSDVTTLVIRDDDLSGSGTADDPYQITTNNDFSLFITKANTDDGASASYLLTADISASGASSISKTFSGTFEGSADNESGKYFTISGLRQPLFNSTNNAVIKNVMLKDVQVSGSGAKGAIAGTANGYTRIYNCGILPSSNKFENETSDISSSDGNCGGLVGDLKDDSRVVNCFSYAKITGGSVKGGIVGNNQTGSTTAVTNEKYANLRTMVVNCMFYGDITGSTGVYPVYGGSKISNTGTNGINNYNFYREKASITPSAYNCSWPASEENLTRFEYYRYLLNSNRELCGWWVGAPSAPSGMSTTAVQAVAKDASLMAKWVLDPSIAPYPILKTPNYYSSVINQVYQPIESSTILTVPKRTDSESKAWVDRTLSTNTIEKNAAPDTNGQTLGNVSVTINAGSHHNATNVTRTYTITAMDIDNNDFCYGKIQLPYYNDVFGNRNGNNWSEKYGDNYTDMVVTGWDISTSEGTAGTFSTDVITGYNFADRNCTAKDTHRVFAQGGFYYVPYGVTSITITAHWADAYYLSNTGGNYDRVYFYDGSNNRSSAGYPFAPAGTRSFGSNEFGGQPINNGTITSVLTNAVKRNSVYDCAIVLVSNYQYRNNTDDIADDNKKPFTLMTVDLNFDNEPDYCFEWQFGGGGQGVTRAFINPVRFDFLPIVELGIAMKEDNSKYLFAIGKVTPYGHFETTETALIHMGQFEYDDQKRTVDGPVILNNGTFDQICRGSESNGDRQHVNYFILGGHVKMPSFTPGSHVRKAVKSRHCAVNVLGGEFEKFFLSGNYNATPTNEGNPHCYIDGGKLDFVASGAKEQIVGNVFWKIDHAYIGEFYGGGINADKPVKGSISTTINRSKVTKFCGGPQFGNMENGKTVTTEATGTTFGVFYGAGNGGTCYSQFYSSDFTNGNPDWETVNLNVSGGMNNYIALTYLGESQGYHAKYELEMINSSAGTMDNAVCRTYMYGAQFATTNTGHVSSTLTDCRVETNFYGGGLLGGVTGNVTSTLKGNTVVNGSVFGGGYGIADLTVDILPKEPGNTYTAPTREANTSVITPPQYPTATTYTWTHSDTFGNTTLSTSSPAILNPNGDGKNYLYTEISLDNLGAISGNATLFIKENAEVKGNVFGGGDQGVVSGNTEVNIE